MKLIAKGAEPRCFSLWKRRNPRSTYRDLDGSLKQDLHFSVVSEQDNLCAYCCEKLRAEFSHNEHILPQSHFPNKTLDYDNIVASCNTPKQCGNGKGAETIDLTPLMPECETELTYEVNGLVSGKTQRANQAIDTLNLGRDNQQNRSLVNKRKSAIENFLLASGAGGLWFEDEDVLILLLDELKNGEFSFEPVITQVINKLINGSN